MSYSRITPLGWSGSCHSRVTLFWLVFSWRIANTSEGAVQETGEINALSVQDVVPDPSVKSCLHWNCCISWNTLRQDDKMIYCRVRWCRLYKLFAKFRSLSAQKLKNNRCRFSDLQPVWTLFASTFQNLYKRSATTMIQIWLSWDLKTW